ncbi:MAG: acyltransferase family protein [Candidatus Sericytochromatia bacterium]
MNTVRSPVAPRRAVHTGRHRQAAAAPALPRTEFRPDIEGLRAVAVLAVVLFHAGVPGLGGGFVGVDVFFVVSGFLITGLLSREVTSTGGLRLARFYGARARRLLPAACTVLIATAIASAAVLPPIQAREVLADSVASALYVGNYRFALHGTDYLNADAAPSPFQHYWSLGVEEQFYLLWPALILATTWLVHRTVRRANSGSAAPFAVVLAMVAAVSFAVSLTWTRTVPPWAFFALPSRAWELAVGGLIALTAVAWRRLRLPLAAIAGAAGMTLILVGCTQLGEHTPYPGTAAVLPVLGTALVIGAGCAAPGHAVGRLLSLAWMRAIGRMSYAWYLWHWPVLLLAPALVGHPLDIAERLIAVAVSGGLAVLTLRLIENPARFAMPLRLSAGRSLALGGAVTAVAVCADLLLLTARPVPVGHGAAASTVTIAAPASMAPSASVDAHDATVQQLTAQVQAAVAASAGLHDVPSNLSPPLAEAAGDKPSVFLNGCVRSWREVGQDQCASGDSASATTVALVGDSHAAMWSPAFEQIAEQRHWRLETMGKVTCPLQNLSPITSPYLGREYSECEQWRGDVISRLQTERPRLIVVSMSRRYGADFGFTSYDPAWLASLTALVAQLHTTGAKVLVLGPVPDPHSTVPTCVSAHLDDTTACSPQRTVAVNDGGIAAEAAATTTGGGQYADLTELFCTHQRCPVIIGNNLVYRDDNHVTIEYAQALGPVIAAVADRAMARP